MPHPRLRRVVRASLYLLATLTLLYASLIAGPMWLTRIRIAHLLADFQSIHPTQSTWADAQHLMTRWGKWGHYDGSCTAQSCDYVIIVNDPLSAMLGHASEAELHFAALRNSLGMSGAFHYAEVYAQWSQSAEALKWLDVAYRTHGAALAMMKTDSLLEPIRKMPQFAAIERRLRYPP